MSKWTSRYFLKKKLTNIDVLQHSRHVVLSHYQSLKQTNTILRPLVYGTAGQRSQPHIGITKTEKNTTKT